MRSLILLFMLTLSGGWELKIDQHGIRVYSKAGRKVREVKTETRVKANVNDVKSLVMDVSSYPQWVHRCERATVLKKISPDEIIYRQEISAPSIIKDAEIIVNMKVEPHENGIKIVCTSVPDLAPPSEKFTRIRAYSSIWMIRFEGDSTYVVNHIELDPPVDVPNRVLEKISVNSPYKTFLGLKRKLN